MKIGQSIKQLRKSKTKLNQRQFAQNIGVSQTYLSQIESDLRHPSTEMLQKIADYLEIPLPILFWFGVTESDVKPEKVEYFKLLKPSIDKMIESIF